MILLLEKERFTTRFAGENGGGRERETKENVSGIEGGEYSASNSRNPFQGGESEQQATPVELRTNRTSSSSLPPETVLRYFHAGFPPHENTATFSSFSSLSSPSVFSSEASGESSLEVDNA
jgi:hypothetical protein